MLAFHLLCGIWMSKQEILNSLAKAVEEYDKDKSMELAKKALKEGIGADGYG